MATFIRVAFPAGTALLTAAALVLVTAAAFAQRGFGGFGREGGRLRIQPNARYDGRFTFVRVQLHAGAGRQLGRRPAVVGRTAIRSPSRT